MQHLQYIEHEHLPVATCWWFFCAKECFLKLKPSHNALHIRIYWYISRAQNFCKQLYIYLDRYLYLDSEFICLYVYMFICLYVYMFICVIDKVQNGWINLTQTLCGCRLMSVPTRKKRKKVNFRSDQKFDHPHQELITWAARSRVLKCWPFFSFSFSSS